MVEDVGRSRPGSYDHVRPLVLPGERRREIQAVRVPLVRLHLQRVVSRSRRAARRARRCCRTAGTAAGSAPPYSRREYPAYGSLLKPREAATGESRRDVSNVRSAALLRSRPNDRSRSVADRVQVDQIVRREPLPAIADIRDVDDEIARHLALQGNAPLVQLRHLAGVRMNPLRRRVDLAWRRPDARVVGDPEQIVAVIHQSGAQQARPVRRRPATGS